MELLFTPRQVSPRRRAEIDERVRYYERRPYEIGQRIEALGHEWDIDRVLEATSTMLAAAGLVLGALVNRRYLALTGVSLLHLAVHAATGRSPLSPVLRRMGFRTFAEIDEERWRLKALRGDLVGDAEAPGDIPRPGVA